MTNTLCPDLVVFPQSNQRVPGDHLSDVGKENVLKSWKRWGEPNPDWGKGSWVVHIVHVVDSVPRLTRVRDIPKVS